jgi:hypothetical protein
VNDTLTLSPLYVQSFDKEGVMEDIRKPSDSAEVIFYVKGYSLKLLDDLVKRQRFPFALKYKRQKQMGFPPRKWEFERYY